MDLLLHRVLCGPIPAEAITELDTWWRRHHQAAAGLTLKAERAAAGGFAADRLGYAFASGYQEALRQLVPSLGDEPTALAATESGGVHPRNILARLEPAAAGFKLNGDKTFVTLGSYVKTLLVVASEGSDSLGRNRLALCCIPSDRSGVVLRELPPTPFVPEIPHATLQLREVSVAPSERLPGDAYDRYLKPFRTIEDLHVHAALLGYLLQLARRFDWPRSIRQELLLLLAGACNLCAAAPDDPAVHLALGGLIASCRRLLGELAPRWAEVDAATRTNWERDRPLLDVAGKARAQRLEAAWVRLLEPPS